jgi:hypothetical protein
VLHGRGEDAPPLDVASELLASGGRRPVALDAAPFRGLTLLAGNPAALLEAIERGIKRSLIHDEHIARHVADALRDRPSVEGPEGERLQDEQVQRALEYFDWFAH